VVLETDTQAHHEPFVGTHPDKSGSNIILIGASGAGKSAVGVELARLLGYGCIDLDHEVEVRAKQSVAEIFATHGEEHFRELESQMIKRLHGMRSHVVATGGGAVMDDENWAMLLELGTTVWLSTPAEEIGRRLLANETELAGRPLLADVLTHKDLETRLKLLTERINALIGNRAGRYRQAHVTVTDRFSTPQSTAHLVRATLIHSGVLNLSTESRPYDRWHIL